MSDFLVEQEKQIILHVDMDAFYASVEMRDNPDLKDKPLIIGAKPTERGVVATCNYEARRYGVRSAMNSKEAFRLCPKAVFLYPDFEKYKAVSEELHEILESYTKQVEYIALDEGYLDLTEVAKDFSEAEKIGREIQRRVAEELRLTCSVGIAYGKTAAKTASEEKKPNGFFFDSKKRRVCRAITGQRCSGTFHGRSKNCRKTLFLWDLYRERFAGKREGSASSFGKSGENALGAFLRH